MRRRSASWSVWVVPRLSCRDSLWLITISSALHLHHRWIQQYVAHARVSAPIAAFASHADYADCADRNPITVQISFLSLMDSLISDGSDACVCEQCGVRAFPHSTCKCRHTLRHTAWQQSRLQTSDIVLSMWYRYLTASFMQVPSLWFKAQPAVRLPHCIISASSSVACRTTTNRAGITLQLLSMPIVFNAAQPLPVPFMRPFA